MKLAPHLHRLGNDVVSSYLVDTADGITLVDAGLPGHWRDLQRELRSLGKSVDDIRGLVLTHGDSDHLGFAERLRSEHGVPVFVHAADAVRARTGEKPKVAIGPVRLGPALGFAGYSLRKYGLRTRYLGEVTEIGDGRTGPQHAPFTDDPAQALSSLDRLSGLSASWVLPGHGAPWRTSPVNVRQAVRKIL